MNKFSQSAIWDNLVRIMPELKDQMAKRADDVDPLIANSLYNIWRNGEGKTSSNVFKKPVSIGADMVDRMKNSGLVMPIGDNLKITSKGEKVIKVMILGDDRSVFEDDGKILDYNKALSHVKGVKTAKSHKVASSYDWWGRFENIEDAEEKCDNCRRKI